MEGGSWDMGSNGGSREINQEVIGVVQVRHDGGLDGVVAVELERSGHNSTLWRH